MSQNINNVLNYDQLFGRYPYIELRMKQLLNGNSSDSF